MSGLFRNPIGWDEEQRASYRRRRTRLTMVAAFVQLAGAVGFGAFFVAAASGPVSLASGLLAGLVALGLVALWRARRPYEVPEPHLVRLDRDDSSDDDPDDEADGGWDLSSALLAAVVVPLAVLVMILLTGIVPLLVILCFHAANNDSGWLQVVVAFGLCLLVSACAEFGIVHPLARRWGIDLDD